MRGIRARRVFAPIGEEQRAADDLTRMTMTSERGHRAALDLHDLPVGHTAGQPVARPAGPSSAVRTAMAALHGAEDRTRAQQARAERDRRLLEGCRRGETRAWADLLADYERLVFSIPLRLGLSREDAADIVQLTFTELLQSLDMLRADERLVGWLAVVARRQSWRLLEKRRRETTVEELPEQAEPDPSDTWTRDAWLYDGLLSLDERCRELIVALYLSSESPAYADVARRLGRPIGSIGPARARCLQRLRAALGD